jgi:hypothetical protein
MTSGYLFVSGMHLLVLAMCWARQVLIMSISSSEIFIFCKKPSQAASFLKSARVNLIQLVSALLSATDIAAAAKAALERPTPKASVKTEATTSLFFMDISPFTGSLDPDSGRYRRRKEKRDV